MINLEKRSYEKELLDEDNIPFEHILVNLRELNTINTLLGGHKLPARALIDFFTEYPLMTCSLLPR